MKYPLWIGDALNGVIAIILVLNGIGPSSFPGYVPQWLAVYIVQTSAFLGLFVVGIARQLGRANVVAALNAAPPAAPEPPAK